jgi:hypothetical protein
MKLNPEQIKAITAHNRLWGERPKWKHDPKIKATLNAARLRIR